jgi:hypothetical protein
MAGVGDKVTFRNEDLFDTDIRKASVLTLYLSLIVLRMSACGPNRAALVHLAVTHRLQRSSCRGYSGATQSARFEIKWYSGL